MSCRTVCVLAVIIVLPAAPLWAQGTSPSGGSPRFRVPGAVPAGTTPAATFTTGQPAPAATIPTTPIGNAAPGTSLATPAAQLAQQQQPAPAASAAGNAITSTSAVLDRSAGQIWREYDISAYTSKVTNTARPEQAIVDWILRETGTEVWFSEPLGLLSASRDKLRVYHTPQMQQVAADMVDRFLKSDAESHVLSLRLVTVGSPDWRSIAHHLLQPVDVQTPGVDAWLLTKENAAILVGELSKRHDYREHNSPNLLIHNGQSQTLSRVRPRNYIRNVRLRENAAGYELEMGQVEEGYSLELSPLISGDGRTIDAVVRCQVEQVESLVPVSIDVPTLNAQRQRVQIQVPQLSTRQLHERFRWPTDHVLLISAGVGATPTSERPTVLGVPNLLAIGPPRADGLLFIESKGKASQSVIEAARNARVDSYHGRY